MSKKKYHFPSFETEHTNIVRRCKKFLWPSKLTVHRFGNRTICALLHSGEVRHTHGPSWLVFRIAKVLTLRTMSG